MKEMNTLPKARCDEAAQYCLARQSVMRAVGTTASVGTCVASGVRSRKYAVENPFMQIFTVTCEFLKNLLTFAAPNLGTTYRQNHLK